MKKVSLLIIVTLLGGSIFFTFSCKKATVDTNTQTAQDLTLCQNEFMRILPCVNSIAILNLAKVKSIARTSGIHYPN